MTDQHLSLVRTLVMSEMRVFVTIWLGQIISKIGSGLTSFAFDVWVYQQTGSITQFAFLTLAITLPAFCIAPIVGGIVDRWNRQWIMVISTICSSICVLTIGILFILGNLEIWHIYLAVAGKSIFTAFSGTAFRASIILMVPENKLGRASGFTQATDSIARLVCPALGGVVLGTLHLEGVIFVDFISFMLAIIPLLVVDIPKLPPTDDLLVDIQQTSFISGIQQGWNYLLTRPGILLLVLLRTLYNTTIGAALILVTPLLLTLTSPESLGFVMSLAGSGMVVGIIYLAIVGDHQENLVNLMFISILLGSCGLVIAGIRPSLILLTISGFFFSSGIPVINGCFQILLQRKIAPQIQGRIFSLNNMISMLFPPLIAIAIGPLADRVLEPLMDFDGPWSRGIGQVIGSGPGRGIGLLFILTGLITILFTLIVYQYEPLRKLETELPNEVDFSSVNSINHKVVDA
ncbi:MFS transporter [Dolichospermum flos-aquae]|jgi:MFS transporter, DHA3 family, macrolide efflux protein|uniref:MFS transporter n=1 Tax=Dolichospermum flos-aquae CCAP 1403/13F TaxID=315271 RepID=A0A6H2C2Y0_DOLFA|nr:MFS transporter [Dolichospermum flos-aquae]QJB46192.1 MFS transporter [Dolichospermum flos-aquae CCAP 1403/13F]